MEQEEIRETLILSNIYQILLNAKDGDSFSQETKIEINSDFEKCLTDYETLLLQKRERTQGAI